MALIEIQNLSFAYNGAKNKALDGVLYSAIMDVWSAVSMTGEFVWQTYLAALTTSLPFTIEYAVSNVIFLLVLYKPMDRRLTRVKLKFGVFGGGNNVPEIVTENF